MGKAWEWITSNKRLRKKAFQTAIEYAVKATPIVQTIEAGLRSTKQFMGDASNVASDVNDIVSKAKEFIPSIQVIGGSMADSAVKPARHAFPAVCLAMRRAPACQCQL